MTFFPFRRHGFTARAPRRGFTLVEMLVVLAILAILAVLSLPAIKGLLGSVDMKGAAGTVSAQLDIARQAASTRNVQAEVRIYQDSSVPDTLNAKTYSYRIIAVCIPAAASGANQDEFISPGVGLPGDTIFDSSTTYSTLLDPGTAAGDPAGKSRLVPLELDSAPALLRKKPYMKFTFLPDGTMYLANTATSSGTWCLTMRNLHAKAVGATPASNYICFVVDPGTSRSRMYQP